MSFLAKYVTLIQQLYSSSTRVYALSTIYCPKKLKCSFSLSNETKSTNHNSELQIYFSKLTYRYIAHSKHYALHPCYPEQVTHVFVKCHYLRLNISGSMSTR